MIQFDPAHKEFIDDLKVKDRSHSTILAYGKDIEQLLGFIKEHLNKTQVDQIEKVDIEGFLNKLEEGGYTKKSISRKINSTKTFFRFLKINEYVTDDPSALIAHPKFETPPPRILEETEYRALRDASRNDTRTYAIIQLLLQTGIRIGELAELKLSNLEIDPQEKTGVLHVPESRATLGRDIPLNEAVASALANYLKERPADLKSDHLFITRTGNPLLVRNIRAAIDRYSKKAGIKKAKVNDLRHTWIAHHIQHGASLLLISKMAGHKRLATTERYLKYVETSEGEKMDLKEL